MKAFRKYILKDGSIYWHKLYFDIVPEWMTKYSPPFGWYNYAFYSYNPHRYIEHLYLEAKWFIQRGCRGYSDSDAWNLGYYVASWMPDALDELINAKNGHPMGMTRNGWETRLRTMREGFMAVKRLEGIRSRKEQVTLERRMEKGLRMFSEHLLSLWD